MNACPGTGAGASKFLLQSYDQLLLLYYRLLLLMSLMYFVGY